MSMQVTVVGGGMIVHDQLLPALYHLQRSGDVGEISIVATSSARIRDLVGQPRFEQGFPGHTFSAYPDPSEPPEQRQPDRYREVVAAMPPRQLVLVATPDPLHHEMVRFCLEHDQHVLCVKPLVLNHADAADLAQLGREKGLFVGVEYHKRFDRRYLEARKTYRAGGFGQFKCGYACLIEPWEYRHSNFQNWFTTDQTDPFTYIGCHYVDALYFISGLRPTGVSVLGVEGAFPNGNVGYMWANARVSFENGGMLSINTGLGYPDNGAGSNDQGMTLYCEGDDAGAVIDHDDQFRGVSHGTIDAFGYVNPDYIRLVPWDGEGMRPVGYGYDSIEALVRAAAAVEHAGREAADDEQALLRRREAVEAIDRRGILATPANSAINELVIEAGRQSILENGRPYTISYDPQPTVQPA